MKTLSQISIDNTSFTRSCKTCIHISKDWVEDPCWDCNEFADNWKGWCNVKKH